MVVCLRAGYGTRALTSQAVPPGAGNECFDLWHTKHAENVPHLSYRAVTQEKLAASSMLPLPL
jgi:hypothetical protein